LNELIKSVIRESGCEDVSAFEDDAFIYLDNPDVQQQVGQFLGPRNTRVLIDELEASSETVRKVAKCISSLVPGFQVRLAAISTIETNVNTAPGTRR
jgi:predicted GTPase